MPPRLVAFLYLQDTPSAEWGATHFLPGTSTAQAHSRFFEAGEADEAEVRPATLSCVPPQTLTPTLTPTLTLTRCAPPRCRAA